MTGSTEYSKIFKDQKVKIIPVKFKSKRPDVPDFKEYLNGNKIWTKEIKSKQNYGVICGKISNNLAIIDIEKIDPDDYHNKKEKPKHIPLESEFINRIIPDYKNQTLTTLTGTYTFHISVFLDKIPDKTSKLIYEKDDDNIYQIDFKVTGQCVEVGSVNEDGNKYKLFSNTTKIKKENLQNILYRLEKIGFKHPNETNSVTDYSSNWTMDELLTSKWKRGERRRKQKSLYCKLRIEGKSIERCKTIIREIMKKHDDKLDDNEIENNFDSSEGFFQKEILPTLDDDTKKSNEKEEKQNGKLFNNDDFSLAGLFIQNRNHIVTERETDNMWYYSDVENFYKQKGDTIIKEECEALINNCKRNTVSEIIEKIKRNGTYIESKTLFDSRYINTINGILDPKSFELKSHSPKYLTTSKLPFRVNFEARNLKLWRHILTIIDVKDINLLMELIWIGISGQNPFKKMFIFKGLTNTQKTTLADIIVWIIGSNNVSREKPLQFLSKDTRFSSSKFIGKRMNIASEIGNLDESMIENQKQLVGGELQNTERKGDNTERHFDPTRFVFLYTTNTLGKIYSRINDSSVITRYQFLIFKNQLDESKTNGQWHDEFFKDDDDKQSTIETIVNIIIHYKKAQNLGKIPKTKWSNIADTKKILDEEMPIQDKYFKDERIIEQAGSKLSIKEIRDDFEKFVGFDIKPHELGFILKARGFKSSMSNGVTYYKGKTFAKGIDENQTTFPVTKQNIF